MQPVRSHLNKVHISTHRLKSLVPAKRLGITLHIHSIHIGYKLHKMPGPRIQEIPSHHSLNPLHINHFQPNYPLPEDTTSSGHVHPRTWVGGGARRVSGGRGRRERSERSSAGGSILRSLKYGGYMQAVGGTEVPGPVGGGGLQAQHIGKSHYASPAVAAHHAACAVRIVELHGEIHLRIKAQDHEPVRLVLPAQSLNPVHGPIGRHVPSAAIQNHEVVSSAGELI